MLMSISFLTMMFYNDYVNHPYPVPAPHIPFLQLCEDYAKPVQTTMRNFTV